jgi:hypothetical protein
LADGEAKLKKIWWFILVIGTGSFLSGIALEGLAMENDSNLMNFLNSDQKDKTVNTLSNSEFKAFSVPLIKNAQLAEHLEIFTPSATIGFDLETTLVNPDGTPNNKDEYFTEGITQCIFHSFDDIPADSCLLCTITSIDEMGEHIPLASGQIELPDGYLASNNLEIPLTEFSSDGANAIENVNGVSIQLCASAFGCTADFWQQEESMQSWPISISPDDTFEEVFERSLSNNRWDRSEASTLIEDLSEDTDQNQNQNNGQENGPSKATLLEVLSYKGSEKRVLAANAVAALLNAETMDTSFAYTSDEVIKMTQEALDENEYDTTMDMLISENELECLFSSEASE